MKILHVIGNLEIGGAELMLKRLVESYLDNLSYQQTVVSLSAIGQVGTKLKSIGVNVIALNMRSTLDAPLAIWRLRRIIRQFRPDIIQTWMYHADLLGGLAGFIAGNRHVIWGVRTTDISASNSLTTVLVRWFCARLSSFIPSVIICAAEASRRSHIAVGYDERKILVVPNGYDFSWLKASAADRQSLREQYNIAHDDVVIGSLGRFHAAKDHENFVRTAGLLSKSFPQLRYMMIGRDLDWSNDLLVEWIDDVGLKDRFVLLGQRHDVPKCLSAMDIFCLHSRNEGFPNVLAEAMAMGLPCVATDVGDAAMLLADTGVVVPSGDSPALENGVVKLMMLNHSERRIFGLKAKVRVESQFSIKRVSRLFEEIYHQVLSKGKP